MFTLNKRPSILRAGCCKVLDDSSGLLELEDAAQDAVGLLVGLGLVGPCIRNRPMCQDMAGGLGQGTYHCLPMSVVQLSLDQDSPTSNSKLVVKNCSLLSTFFLLEALEKSPSTDDGQPLSHASIDNSKRGWGTHDKPSSCLSSSSPRPAPGKCILLNCRTNSRFACAALARDGSALNATDQPD